jgi:hypothetical protein
MILETAVGRVSDKEEQRDQRASRAHDGLLLWESGGKTGRTCHHMPLIGKIVVNRGFRNQKI